MFEISAVKNERSWQDCQPAGPGCLGDYKLRHLHWAKCINPEGRYLDGWFGIADKGAREMTAIIDIEVLGQLGVKARRG